MLETRRIVVFVFLLQLRPWNVLASGALAALTVFLPNGARLVSKRHTYIFADPTSIAFTILLQAARLLA